MKKKETTNKVQKVQLDTIVGNGAAFNGTLSVVKPTMVDGIITGDCSFSATAIIGTNGVITGNVNCSDIRIEGKINGNISSSGRVEMLSTASVYGDIETSKLIIDEGAMFEGKCLMGSKPSNLDDGIDYLDLDK